MLEDMFEVVEIEVFVEGFVMFEEVFEVIVEGEELGGCNIDVFYNVKFDVCVVLGCLCMLIFEFLELIKGLVIELDCKVGDLIDIMINDCMVVCGDLVKVNGEFIGVVL